MNPDHDESTESVTTKKRKGSKKDVDDEGSSKKKSKKSKAHNKSPSDAMGITEDSDDMRAPLSPLFPLSPPTSDDNSMELNDFLRNEIENGDMPSQSDKNNNLAVTGFKIEAPEWWTDSLSCENMRGILDSSGAGSLPLGNNPNMTHHPWSEARVDIDDAMATLEDVEYIMNQSLTANGLALQLN